ncbi:MAG: dihydroneopterin triphosphate diphosphatase [Gallionella sp.]
MTEYKRPVSVLVVIYTSSGQATSPSSVQTSDVEVLLLERADHLGYWQSVTGSVEAQEELAQTAAREVFEETGIVAASHELCDCRIENHYEIYPQWRHRYAPGVTQNVEHVFTLRLTHKTPVTLSVREHLQYGWWPWREAAERVFSPSNREAILKLAVGEYRADGKLRSGNE